MLLMDLVRVRSEASTLCVAKKLMTSSRCLDGAERACSRDDADTGVRGELRVDLLPVLADVVPCLRAGVGITEEAAEDDPTVLIADLTGDGVVQCALDEGGVLEARKSEEGLGLELGAGESFAGIEDLVVEGIVTVGGGDDDSLVGEGGIEVLVALASRGVEGIGDLTGLG